MFIDFGLSTVMVVPLTGEMVECGANISTEGYLAVVLLATLPSFGYILGLRSDSMVDTSAGTVLALVTGMDISVFAGADAKLSTVMIGILEFESMPTSSEEPLFLGCEACNFWTTATSASRPLQA